MNTVPYLQFQLEGGLYGLPTSLVKTVFYLPELTLIPDTPGDILGVINWQGRILPIMHLAKRLGLARPLCSGLDPVIVIRWQELDIGIIVQEVHTVVQIHPEHIHSEPNYGRLNPSSTLFIQGVVPVAELNQLIIIINPETLIRSPDVVSSLSDLHPSELVPVGDFYSQYYPDATEADRATLQARAQALALKTFEQEMDDELLSLAIVTVGQQSIGIPLTDVKEFISIEHYSPIPCCPDHIIGIMNLRGEILTLVDIGQIIDVSTCQGPVHKAVVLSVEDWMVGAVIDEIYDAVELPRAALNPSVSPEQTSHTLGTILQREQVISVLNTRHLLQAFNLFVEP